MPKEVYYVFVLTTFKEGVRVELHREGHGALECNASAFDLLCGEGQVQC